MVSRKYKNFVGVCSWETNKLIRDASKRGEHSSKLLLKFTHTAQDAILK